VLTIEHLLTYVTLIEQPSPHVLLRGSSG